MADYKILKEDGVMHTSAGWKDFDEDITAVVIDRGVTSIGSYAFFRCTILNPFLFWKELSRLVIARSGMILR